MTEQQRRRLDEATAHLEPPFAVVDLDALRANARDLVRRATPKPVRIASKSVRCREVVREVLAAPGWSGVLSYTLAEALWLATDAGDCAGLEDVVVGYPTVEREALRQLASDPLAAARITLMVDSVDHLDLIDSVVASGQRPDVRVCIDLDASLRLLGSRLHVGPRRSPTHDAADAVRLARAVVDRPGFRLVGLMAYEGQVAGVGDSPPGKPLRARAIRAMQAMSVRELAQRRTAVVSAVSRVAHLDFVNGGGTGSLESTAAESAVTEVAAGSGLFAPTLFDSYRAFRCTPAAFFALSVTRRPAPGIVTVAGGGWIASGPTGADRQPTPTYPEGLRLIGTEGAGEVQTPVTGAAADRLQIGDRVWFRHAKAGELCEHVDVVHLVEGNAVTAVVPTYRGEGKTFM